MEMSKRSRLKKWIIALLFVGIIAVASIWYIFNLKFEDTTTQQAAFEVDGISLINEFQKNDSAANKKYTEKIITIKGVVSEMELADSTVNIKIIDSLTDGYLIFAFQEKNAREAQSLKEGDIIKIKGSCSGGTYSEILETHYISFKRCVLIK